MEQSIKQNIGMSITEVVHYRNGTVHQTKYRYVKCQLQRLYAIGMEQSIKQNIGMSITDVVHYRNGTVHQTKYRYVN